MAPCPSMAGDAAGKTNLGSVLTSPTLPFTGERIVPGQVSEPLFREHEARYVFASRFVKDKAVLDVSCGTGIGTHYLLTEGAHSCLGLDIDRPAIDYARAAYEGCQFEECDATNLCIPDSSIDVVVSFETIEHLKDQLKFLSECHRVLRPGGVLVCSTPNHTMSRWAPKNPYHLHEFTMGEFRRALETIFVDVQLFGQQNTNHLLYAGQRLLSRALHALQLMETAKSLFRRQPPPAAMPTAFGGMPKDSDSEVQPYRAALLMQPRYVIAVARRPH
ncbi:MAG TPA: class I SAM-dependent methyltransferase [Candidatus Polarisedimenticolia bacterium]|nr:class I SAM-dependent methyltransferase [Candidatus Polarisedimenticolia bacterium]